MDPDRTTEAGCNDGQKLYKSEIFYQFVRREKWRKVAIRVPIRAQEDCVHIKIGRELPAMRKKLYLPANL